MFSGGLFNEGVSLVGVCLCRLSDRMSIDHDNFFLVINSYVLAIDQNKDGRCVFLSLQENEVKISRMRVLPSCSGDLSYQHAIFNAVRI